MSAPRRAYLDEILARKRVEVARRLRHQDAFSRVAAEVPNDHKPRSMRTSLRHCQHGSHSLFLQLTKIKDTVIQCQIGGGAGCDFRQCLRKDFLRRAIDQFTSQMTGVIRANLRPLLKFCVRDRFTHRNFPSFLWRG